MKNIILCVDEEIYINKDIKITLPKKGFAIDLFSALDKHRVSYEKNLLWLKCVKSVDDLVHVLSECLTCHRLGISRTHVITLNNKAVGMISFYFLGNDYKSMHVGYWVNRDHSNKKIISNCLRYLLNMYRLQGFKKFFLTCSKDNKASIAVAKNCGFLTLTDPAFHKKLDEDQNLKFYEIVFS